MGIEFFQKFQSYYDNLPEKIFPTIGQSAGLSLAVGVLLSASLAGNGLTDLSRPLLHAGVAAIASTIHALLTPLFNQIFGPSRTDNPVYELIKSCSVAVIASSIVGLSLNSKLQLTAFKLYYLISINSFHAWFSGSNKQSQLIKENSVYFCF